MSDALEYAKRAIKSEDDHPGVDPHVLLLARAVVRQDEELAALREKCRWRKQSEEPAPEGEVVFVRYRDFDDERLFALAPIDNYYDQYGEPFYLDIEWRPVDLPEEEM